MDYILITGGAGFIGSHCVDYLLEKHKNVYIVNLDSFTYAANPDNIAIALQSDRYTLVKGDIRNKELISYLFNIYNFQGVIHFAAESHVDNSIEGPEAFIQTNILGTQILLDVARRHWLKSPFDYKSEFKNARFHHVSTDEVYGSLDFKDDPFTELSPYAPNSPYSASKAGSDMLVRSYNRTYGLNTVITNCSNNFGPRQHNEKLIPVIIKNALSHSPIPIYGDGKNIRDWLYVKDHCKAIDLVFRQGEKGEIYNIGGDNEISNIDIAKRILKILDEVKPRNDGKSYLQQITFVKDRPGHDLRYAISSEKLKKELHWSPSHMFPEILKNSVLSYLD